MDGMINYMKALVARSELANGPKEGDYKDQEGFWVCHVCKSRKQTSLDCFGETLHPFIPCKCKESEERARADYNIKIQAANDLEKRRNDCFPQTVKGTPMLSMTFEGSNGANEVPMRIAQRYCQYFEEMINHGEGLLLWGNRGTGKTYIAGCIANALLDAGKKVKWVNMSKIISQAQKGDFVPEDYNAYHLLIIDDFGTERDTTFSAEVILSLIEERTKNSLPMIVTTYLNLERIKETSGITRQGGKQMEISAKSLAWQKILEFCTPIEVNSKDERKARIWEKQKFIQETLLG